MNDTHCTPPEVFEPVLAALRLERFGLDAFGNPDSDVPTQRVIMLPAFTWRVGDETFSRNYMDEVFARGAACPFEEVLWGNAFELSWSGYGAVWCNGPTSKCALWAEKTQSDEGGDENVSLWPVRTASKWWQRHVAFSDAVCFLERRVKFKGSRHYAPWHNALGYVGPRGDLFVEGMRRYGWCVRNRRNWG